MVAEGHPRLGRDDRRSERVARCENVFECREQSDSVFGQGNRRQPVRQDEADVRADVRDCRQVVRCAAQIRTPQVFAAVGCLAGDHDGLAETHFGHCGREAPDVQWLVHRVASGGMRGGELQHSAGGQRIAGAPQPYSSSGP